MKQITPILISILLFLSSCSTPVEEVVEKKLRPVNYKVLEYVQVGTTRTFNGTVRSDRAIQLSFRTSGILNTLNLYNGQTVKKGDLLAEIDNSEAKLALEKSISNRQSAKSNMNTASSNLMRTRTLYEQGGASLREYENAKSEYAAAKANFESAERSVDIQNKQVKYGIIKAPADGTISSKSVENNENISAGQVIATLNAGNFMVIQLGLPENVINQVVDGMEVEINIASLGKTFKGLVNEISTSTDTGTSTYPVQIKIEDSSARIKAGMAAQVVFTFSDPTLERTLVVPVPAVGMDSKGHFVFTIEPQADSTGTVRKRYFHIGKLTPWGFIVSDGLEEGQFVATAGLQSLLDGQRVRLK
ncbi:MAG: efflux transporter periplasmic adaptor subunit [Acidobacteria bacterium]|nr:MAG: efflux transporter periplasmic adaptor subunit [Acidobacteriota bacterium]